MTEDEWFTTTDPAPMLHALDGRTSARKVRLFACACCRLVWDSLTPLSSKRVVEVAERYADGEVSERELNQARSLAAAAAQKSVRHGSRFRSNHPAREREGRQFFAADVALTDKNIKLRMMFPGHGNPVVQDEMLKAAAPSLLRCVFQCPSVSTEFHPSWRTEAAVALARGMYETRSFDAAPILADALEEAGCSDAAVLGHLRGGGPHVRGCYVCDAVLGLE